MEENNFNIDVTQGIERVIWKSIEESIKNRNIESFDKLNDFIEDVLLLSIENKSLTNYKKYINFPSSYLKVSHRYLKENISYSNIHIQCITSALELFKYILKHELTYSHPLDYTDIKEIDIICIRTINEFIYQTINSFNRLLYNSIQIQSLQDFKNCYKGFINIENYDNRSIRSNYNIQYYSFKDLKKDDEERNTIKAYEEIKKSNDLIAHVKIGLRYWSLFLYSMKINDLNFTKELFNTVELHLSIPELVNEIIFLRYKQISGYLEWRHWDYIERESGISYSPPDPRNWMLFGLLIDLVRNGIDDLLYQQYSYKQKKELQDLYLSLGTKTHILTANFENWKDLLNCESEAQLESKITSILSFFENMNKEVDFEKIKSISEADLNIFKVDDFKERLKTKIKINSLFLNLLSDILDGDFIQNVKVNEELYVANFKAVFIDEPYSIDLPGTEGSLSQQFSNCFDDQIISALIQHKEKSINSKVNLLETLSNCVVDLEKIDKKVFSVIISSQDFNNSFESFYSNENFIQNSNSEIPFLKGEFKNIKIYITENKQMEGKFLMWEDNEVKFNLNNLETTVLELTETEIETEFHNNSYRWNRNTNGIELSENTSKALIKNGVNIGFSIDGDIKKDVESTILLAEFKR